MVTNRVERHTWPAVRLGDVVLRHQEIIREPRAEGLHRFLLVEHMDRDRLRVARWGDIDSEELPPTFYNAFRRGHVLYPSRNPHLRRTCRPNFDGICGEKTFVLQATEALSQDLLPFVLQSERFIRHAVRMKIGSTNPHVRWRDIAAFEFKLPPPEHQAQIASVLLALEDLLEFTEEFRGSIAALCSAHLNDFFAPRLDVAVPLPTVVRIEAGKTPTISRKEFWGGRFPWASGKDLAVRQLLETEDSLTELGWQHATVAPKGATLIVVRGMILAHTFPVSQCGTDVAFNQDVRALVASDAVDPDFLFLWAEWAGRWFLRRTSESSHGTKKLDVQVLREARLPVPPTPVQRTLVEDHSALREGMNAVSLHLTQLRGLKKALLDELFGGTV